MRWPVLRGRGRHRKACGRAANWSRHFSSSRSARPAFAAC